MSPFISDHVDHTTSAVNGQQHQDELIIEPLEPTGILDEFESFDVTPVIGTEFPEVKLVDLLQDPNSDELLRELAVIVSRRGVVFFRAQDDLTDELQKLLVTRMGELTGEPESSTLHIHPMSNVFDEKDKHVNVIGVQAGSTAVQDELNPINLPLSGRDGWHSDTVFEACPSSYTFLRMVKITKTGGDTIWASGYELLDKISPTYRKFLESLTATFHHPIDPKKVSEQGYELYLDARGSPDNVGIPRAVHPVIRTNPVTGWKSLFGVSKPHFVKYNELTEGEGDRLHDELLSMIVENIDTQIRHRWQNENDVAIWDNRSVFHTPNKDYAGLGERIGRRVVGIGERAYLDPNSKTRREALAAENSE